jgi:hypothetical protein
MIRSKVKHLFNSYVVECMRVTLYGSSDGDYTQSILRFTTRKSRR